MSLTPAKTFIQQGPACADQQQAFYNEWVTKFDLPPEQFERDYKTQLQEVSKDNFVMRRFTPALPRFRWVEAIAKPAAHY